MTSGNVKRFIEDVENKKVLYVREMTLKQAKKEIIEYLKEHSHAFVSEMAEDLRIDVELAFRTVEELEKEGVVEE